VQVELPEGSSARLAAPLNSDGHSLFWAAYGSGKRSLVCDYTNEEGRKTLLQLVEKADFILESSGLGKLEKLGLSYQQLSQINPGLIYLSLSAFGSDGPKSDYAETDLIVWAASGYLLLSRDGIKPPVRFSVPQAYLHAAADGVSGVLIAHFERLRSGLGQHVDVSAQQSTSLTSLGTCLAAQIGHADFSVPGSIVPPKKGDKKQLDLSGSGSRTKRPKWQLKDGLAEMHLAIGPAAGNFANNMIAWMASEKAIDDDIALWDWRTLPEKIHANEVTDADIERARDQVGAFLANFNKSDLIEKAIEKKLLLAPILTSQDLVNSPHHAARHFFQEVKDTVIGNIKLPGNFAFGCENGFVPISPAPELGADTSAVLRDWADQSPNPAVIQEKSGDGIDKPLCDLKVLDLAWVVAGPLVGRALADFGAVVIRVESSTRIETARMMGPFPNGKVDPQQSGLFENCNAGKLGMTINMATEEGRIIIRDLVKWADVVIESFSPGQMAKWGLGYESLKAIKPDIIMLSTSLMGQSGPYSRFAGYGNIGAAVSGFQGLVGWSGDQPIGPFGPYSDFIGPRFATAALLAALDHRARTGEGRWMDVSQAESGIQFLAPYIADYTATGRIVSTNGNRDEQISPSGVFSCLKEADEAEAWVAIAARNDQEWSVLARHIGGPSLEQDLRFDSFQNRKNNEDDLEDIIEKWTRNLTANEVEHQLQSMGIPAHKLLSTVDMAKDTQLEARQHFVHLPHKLMSDSVVESTRMKLSRTPGNPEFSAPTFGRDNTKVLSEILRYSNEQIEALNESGVLS